MKKIKIMSLWMNKTKDGDMYLTGKLPSGNKVMAFKNTYKKTEKEPDFNVFICEDEKAEEKNQAKSQSDYRSPISNDDVPF